MTPALEPLRRIAAYALCRGSAGEALLVRASTRSGTPGIWSLPGGAVDHGEHPNDTVVRETAAETGLSVAVEALADVHADMRSLPHRGVTIHTDRLIYRVRVRGGSLIDRVGQPTDLARWVPEDELRDLPLRPFTAAALGVPAHAPELRPDEPPDFPSFYAYPGPDGLHRAQRFAAYAVASDIEGRLLLTRVARGYPGEGYPIDWHGVRAFYRVSVDLATAPTVRDVGGSTAEARWFTVDEVDTLELTEITTEALARLAS